MTVVVTGAAGMIGANLLRGLNAIGEQRWNRDLYLYDDDHADQSCRVGDRR